MLSSPITAPVINVTENVDILMVDSLKPTRGYPFFKYRPINTCLIGQNTRERREILCYQV